MDESMAIPCFFTRDLIVEGNTEAVVVLRNALDDLDGNIFDDLAASWGANRRKRPFFFSATSKGGTHEKRSKKNIGAGAPGIGLPGGHPCRAAHRRRCRG
jgi:hypothetical protein